MVEEKDKAKRKELIKEKPPNKFFIQQTMRDELERLKNMDNDKLIASLGESKQVICLIDF